MLESLKKELSQMAQYREITADIVLIDIINFSKLDSRQHLEIISFLTRSYRKVIEKMLSHSDIVLETFIMGFIPTGDGFYCILNPKYKGYGVILGLSFNHFSDQIAKMFPYFHGIRIAVHTEGINQFRDILGHKNFIGDGLKAFTISTVMVSDATYANLKKFLSQRKDYEELLYRREFKHSEAYIFKDKHGMTKRAYLVWMRKSGIITPPKYRF